MRKILVFLPIAMIMLIGSVSATMVTNISTGVNSDGSLINYGNFDDQWEVISAPDGVPLNYVSVVTPSRSHFADFAPNARWVSDGADK